MDIVLNGTVENSIALWLMVHTSFQTKRSSSEDSQSQTCVVNRNVILNVNTNFWYFLLSSRVNQPISLYNFRVLIDRVVPVTILAASSWWILKNTTYEIDINLIQSITFNCKLQFSQDTKNCWRRTNIVNMRMPFAIVTQCYSRMFMIEGCW